MIKRPIILCINNSTHFGVAHVSFEEIAKRYNIFIFWFVNGDELREFIVKQFILGLKPVTEEKMFQRFPK